MEKQSRAPYLFCLRMRGGIMPECQLLGGQSPQRLYVAMTRGYNPPPTLSSTQATLEMHRTASAALEHPLLSIVVPIYNERATIEEITRRVQENPLRKEVILVDDGSTDGTRHWLLEMQQRQAAGEHEAEILGGRARLRLGNLHFLFQDRNQGKGAAPGLRPGDRRHRAGAGCGPGI